ncbi:MAG: LamG domain-containing protein [Kiritimatiellae bacterium]|nr:LamG domain-containing protein [Kiritimatiellia bacterium]
MKIHGSLLVIWLGLTAANAAITVDAHFRLGENDPGAAAGQPGQNPTRDVTGTLSLSIGAGAPTNSSLVSAPAAAHTGSTLSMQFPGATRYTTNVALNASTDNYGLEAWFRPESLSGSQIIAMNGNGNAGAGYGLWLYNGAFRAIKYPASYLSSGLSATAGQWYHLALVVTSGVGRVYVNGLASDPLIPTTGVPSGGFAIGSEPNGNNPFNGYVDEVRLFHFNPGEFRFSDLLVYPTNRWPEAAYTAEVLGDDPVALYRLNETEGPIAVDLATNAAPSAQQGAQDAVYRKLTVPVGETLTTVAGPPLVGFEAGNTAPYFDGIDDNVYQVLPLSGSSYSIELWVRPYRLPTTFVMEYFAGLGDNTGFDAIGIVGKYTGLPIGEGNAGKLVVFNGVGAVIGSTVLATNSWNHVAVTRNDNTVSLYINSVLDGSGTLTRRVSNGKFIIGDRPDTLGTHPFGGDIDEVVVYDRALTAEDIGSHYGHAYLGDSPPATSTPYSRAVLADDPLAYYRMNETSKPFMADMAATASPSAQKGAQMGLYRTQFALLPGALDRAAGPLLKGFEAGNSAPFFNGAWTGNEGQLSTTNSNAKATMPPMGTNYSMEVWINSTRLGDTAGNGGYLQYFMGRGGAMFDTLAVGGEKVFWGANLLGKLVMWNNVNTAVIGTSVMATQTWYHVVATRQDETVSLYLNGEPEASGTLPPTFSNSDFYLGTRPNNVYPFQGYMDEAAIYDRVLTAEEVRAHYQMALRGPPRGTVIMIP